MTTTGPTAGTKDATSAEEWHLRSADAALAHLGSDPDRALDSAAAAERLVDTTPSSRLSPSQRSPVERLKMRSLGLGGVAITIMSTEAGFLQSWLKTTELTGGQWALCIGAGLVFAVAVEVEKAVRRRAR
jgi:hypothetical protein